MPAKMPNAQSRPVEAAESERGVLVAVLVMVVLGVAGIFVVS